MSSLSDAWTPSAGGEGPWRTCVLPALGGGGPPTSVRSGWGLLLVGSVCWRQPPVDSSSRSLEFLHFIRRF